MANGQTKYKGSKGPALQGYERKWAKGKGWESYSFYKGAEAQIFGKIAAMQAFCSEITVRNEPPYVTLIGHYGSFDEGQINETPDLVWELEQSAGSISIYAGDSADLMNATQAGSVSLVRCEVNKYLAGSGGIPNPNFDAIDVMILSDARTMFNLAVAQNDAIKICQPVLTKTQIISDGDSSFVNIPIPSILRVYTSTGALQSVTNMPDNVYFDLPAGQWLEYAPRIRTTSYDKKEITQQWEFADEWDEFLYPNRV